MKRSDDPTLPIVGAGPDSTGDALLDARLDHHRDLHRAVAMLDGLLNQVQSYRRSIQRLAGKADLEAALAIHDAHGGGLSPIRRHGGTYGIRGFGTSIHTTFRIDPIPGLDDDVSETLSADDQAELDHWSKRGPVRMRGDRAPRPPAPELTSEPKGGPSALSVWADDGGREP